MFGEVMEKTVDQLIASGRVPSNDVAVRMLLKDFTQLKDPFQQVISEAAVEAAGQGRLRAFNDLARQGMVLSFSEFSPLVSALIATQAFTASASTINRMIGDVMGNLNDSYEKGIGIDEAAEALRGAFQGMQDWELRRVARTEINSNQNLGAYRTVRELRTDYLQWWSAADERVRATHAELHGQIVHSGTPFSNGLNFPGDRDNGPIEEWVNCRCVLVPFLMPEGYMAPIGAAYFYEGDLVPVTIDDIEKIPDITEEAFVEELRAMIATIEGDGKYARMYDTVQEAMERGIVQHLKDGRSIFELLPNYDLNEAPMFVTRKKMQNLLEGILRLPERVQAIIRRNLDAATDWLAQHVNPSVLRNAKGLKALKFESKVRSNYNRSLKLITWNGGQGTFIHEYGHHIHDHGNVNIKSLTKTFIRRRSEGEKLEIIYVGGGKKEEGYRDKFIDHYVGKVYPWESKTAPYGTEVISTGLQYMYDDPTNFYTKDPEHFSLILAIIRGVL